MSEFNRDRFKAAKLEVNKKVADEVDKTFARNSSERGDYHTIDDGINIFRLMPPHDIDEPSFQAKVVTWLPCKIEETDTEGKKTGKMIVKDRPIFDSRIHGGTIKDIIDEYIKFTKKVIMDGCQDKVELSRLLAPINGWRDQSKKWHQGILPNQSFVCYATKGDILPQNLGRLELWKQDKEQLEKLNISEESDEPIITDNFSDPDSGCQFIITKGKDDKGNYYKLFTKKTFTAPKGAKDVGRLYEEFVQSQIVPDSVLEKLNEMEPLSKQFKNSYKRTDFERALDALRMFDDKNAYHTFDNDEFLEIVAELDSFYPYEENQVSEAAEAPNTPSLLPELSEMTRTELKKFIEEKNLGIKIFPAMPETLIVEMIQAALEDQSSEASAPDPLPWDLKKTKGEESKSTVVSSQTRPLSLKERVELLKNKKVE